MNPLARTSGRFVAIAGALAVLCAVVGVASGQGAATVIPAVQLSAEPLSVHKAKPTLTLALSVEYPTVGAAYVTAAGGDADATYAPARAYIGHFDPDGCYSYDKANGYFVRAEAAAAHACDGSKFSGNFMNWATTSAIDILRYSLTGGDRVVDTADTTVLQRAALPPDFYNTFRFPSKQLLPTLAAGAVPAALRAGTTGTVYVANCTNRVYFGTAATGNCDAPGDNGNLGPGTFTSEAFFYARVRVCDSADAASRPALCLLQPSGRYKPVGHLQRHSDRLRVAAFGYRMRATGNSHYGGVLRAPMKYVGPQAFDSDYNPLAGLNPALEWDPATGVFAPNPDGAAQGASGVINYLNQFGRTGEHPNEYKSFDPVGELYYEALRYLQGLPPTPQAIEDLQSSSYAGFPIYTTWADPHPAIAGHSTTATDAYACVVNNLLEIGDVRANADKSLPGNTVTEHEDFVRPARPDYNEPDMVAWTRIVGAFESGASMTYVDGNGVTRTTRNLGSVNSNNANLDTKTLQVCCGGGSYYMAGAAYWANTHDIRPDGLANYPAAKARPGMRVRTYMIDVNEGGEQTLERRFKQNQFYLAAKYGGFLDRSLTGNPFLSKDGASLDNTNWSRPVATSVASDGLVARNYFQASDTTEFLASLDAIFAQVLREEAALANVAVASTRLTTETALFQGRFDSADWSGDLVRYRLGLADGRAVIGSASDATTRFAAAELDKPASVDTRRIFVGRTTPDAGGTATEFTWSSLDADQREALRRAPAPALLDDEATGQQRLAYLRGDRSLEAGGTLRRRGSRLGDIVHSGAVFSGRPAHVIGDSGHASFVAAHSARPDTVFVGANDGMLHAFDATTMAELFAYIPSVVVPNLRELTLPTYTHRSYVDATAAVGEAQVGTAWKTVLVSGLGGGGQGVFALDVSNPASFGAAHVLWEFSDRHDASMGHVIGRPRLLKLRTSAPKDTPAYKWFAVVASGVNNAVSDGHASPTGQAAIFILDLAKTATTDWQLGVNYFKIELPTSDPSKANGIVGFSVVKGTAGELQWLYAGDLQGNLWKLNFAAAGSAQWNATTLSAFKSGSTPLPFFKATDASGAAQPITAEPEVAFGPQRGTIVTFGTGKFLEPADQPRPYQTQSFYAVYDNRVDRVAGRGFLQAAATTDTGEVRADAFAWGVPASATQTALRAGWYFDFPGAADGERQVGGTTLSGGSVIFGTLHPPESGCGQGGGRLYAIDLASARGSFVASTVGLQSEPLLMKLGADTLSDATSDGRASQETRYQVIASGSAGIKVSALDPAIPPQSVLQRSWRQVFNLEEMRSKP